ncbi:hypothetical protein CN327_30140 [Bacillus cereus]|nr:hypothetical protein CON53_30105 [Bacillus cereus]PES62552.1 hypothetical protein CN509_31170 [Bacillus cereus]PES95006.1 hypothetical protein CN505_30420 [Bacillus cereus]PFF26945.1 hypothetical protein CN327_30140 [Bacillus cereus]PFI39015.1 hypothetical protein COI73_30955 [Bacillus cereus]
MHQVSNIYFYFGFILQQLLIRGVFLLINNHYTQKINNMLCDAIIKLGSIETVNTKINNIIKPHFICFVSFTTAINFEIYLFLPLLRKNITNVATINIFLLFLIFHSSYVFSTFMFCTDDEPYTSI